MESIKPVVEKESILSLLKETFDLPIHNLTSVEGGLAAQTLSFGAGDDEYILRFNPSNFDASFQKEFFIYKNFASPSIPIPPILKVGVFRDLPYAISKKMPGRGLQSLSKAEYEQTLPSIIQTLYAIHHVDVHSWNNYGWIGDNGIGMFSSWKNFIAKIIEEERPDGFYGKWHTLFQTTFLERDFFERIYNQMLLLLEFCQEERYFVHGEYGYNNVLAENGNVTAVLDWIDAMYGDFVYDIAGFDFWSHDTDFPELFRQYYVSHGVALPDYQERVVCYKYYKGLDALRFFAKTNNREAYQSTRQILQALLKI
ncbi:MAG: aminoglycoside phosphotransferase family protein [Chloroflexi bacterium]|nr:aminoglycoside phosphotransferase family protein [Chloroflexota bacterium]